MMHNGIKTYFHAHEAAVCRIPPSWTSYIDILFPVSAIKPADLLTLCSNISGSGDTSSAQKPTIMRQIFLLSSAVFQQQSDSHMERRNRKNNHNMMLRRTTEDILKLDLQPPSATKKSVIFRPLDTLRYYWTTPWKVTKQKEYLGSGESHWNHFESCSKKLRANSSSR